MCFTARLCLIHPRVCAVGTEAASGREDGLARKLQSERKGQRRFGFRTKNHGVDVPKKTKALAQSRKRISVSAA